MLYTPPEKDKDANCRRRFEKSQSMQTLLNVYARTRQPSLSRSVHRWGGALCKGSMWHASSWRSWCSQLAAPKTKRHVSFCCVYAYSVDERQFVPPCILISRSFFFLFLSVASHARWMGYVHYNVATTTRGVCCFFALARCSISRCFLMELYVKDLTYRKKGRAKGCVSYIRDHWHVWLLTVYQRASHNTTTLL